MDTCSWGPSETVGKLEREFSNVDSHWRIYQKTRDVRLLDSIPLATSSKLSRLPISRKSTQQTIASVRNSRRSQEPMKLCWPDMYLQAFCSMTGWNLSTPSATQSTTSAFLLAGRQSTFSSWFVLSYVWRSVQLPTVWKVITTDFAIVAFECRPIRVKRCCELQLSPYAAMAN